MGRCHDEVIEPTIIILDTDDRRNYDTVYRKLAIYTKIAHRILTGINVYVPPAKRKQAEMLPEQTHIHYEPRKEESVKGLWDVMDDMRKLHYTAYRIKDKQLRRELYDEIDFWEYEILSKLHWA